METNNSADMKDPSLKGAVGLLNLGNTCYSNSTIQLLRTCPEWNMYCLTSDFSQLADTKYKPVMLAYQDLLKPLWSAYKPSYIRPMGFLNEIRKAVKGTVYEMFGHPIPNDSHEFLVYLLDNFHEALKTTTDYTPQNSDDMSVKAENAWNEFISKNTSEIVKLFFGMFRKTIECSRCLNKTYKWEVFNTLKIPCEGETFNEWIQNECKPTEIESYQCDKCTPTRTNAKIHTHVWKMPPNLFVTLRRFHYDGRKDMTNSSYDSKTLTFKDIFAEESNDPSKDWNYDIAGISDHHGTHMGGHYTAQFKHPVTGEWWLIDDESTQKMDAPKVSPSNYIYLFRKI